MNTATHTPTFRVTYRDGWEKRHTFDLTAANIDAAKDAALAWKGNAPISIESVVEVYRDGGLTYCAACGGEIEEIQEEPHPEDADDFVEFPAGEFPADPFARLHAALAKAGA
jgi:hypothetical protein